MPNWCNNVVTMKHENPEMMARAKAAFAEGTLISEFYPCPQELVDTVAGYTDEENAAKRVKNIEQFGYPDWYDWCVANWGTKWDISPNSHCVIDENGYMTVSFDTAWTPPIGALGKLEELGFIITCYYHESGMGFCGVYSDGFDDYYEYDSLDADGIKESIPADIDEMFEISENVRQWQEENSEA